MVFIRSIQGNTLVFDVSSAKTVGEVKALVAAEEGWPVEEQRLLFAGRQLEDDFSLADYDVVEESTLHLNLCLVGGGKKRKKKQYTGPKKQKHVRKKQKLAVLKLYKISDNNEIQRQRLECTEPTCGGGIFMAKHKDRHYCGKCHSTLTEK